MTVLFNCCLADQSWREVPYQWMDCPKQAKGSKDCAIFVIRYIDCLSRDAPLDFNQVIIYLKQKYIH